MNSPPSRASREGRRGVLLINLGTPQAPTRREVRRYLAEFLSDPRVVDAPRWWWLPLLHGVILPTRSGRVARAYGRIWSAEGSPLLGHTRALARTLEQRLGNLPVAAGMRYGSPSLAAALAELESRGVEEVLALPLFPQASRTTTGTIEAALVELAERGLAPGPIRLLPAFPTDPGYIGALGARIDEARGGETFDRLILSFHGLPERYVAAGDPYREQCESTARALAAHLHLGEGEWELCYQSRFGREPWLRPYLAERLPELAREGARRLLVAVPGFAADCLETLDEIGIGLSSAFEAAGGDRLRLVPALNASPPWVGALEAMVRQAASQPW